MRDETAMCNPRVQAEVGTSRQAKHLRSGTYTCLAFHALADEVVGKQVRGPVQLAVRDLYVLVCAWVYVADGQVVGLTDGPLVEDPGTGVIGQTSLRWDAVSVGQEAMGQGMRQRGGATTCGWGLARWCLGAQ